MILQDKHIVSTWQQVIEHIIPRELGISLSHYVELDSFDLFKGVAIIRVLDEPVLKAIAPQVPAIASAFESVFRTNIKIVLTLALGGETKKKINWDERLEIYRIGKNLRRVLVPYAEELESIGLNFCDRDLLQKLYAYPRNLEKAVLATCQAARNKPLDNTNSYFISVLTSREGQF